MAKVVKSLHRHFGVRRSKDQLRKRWSDLKLREHEQYRSGECCKKVSSCPVFLFFMFITFVLFHVLFLQVYIFTWQISCSWVHYSFVSNIFLSAYKTPLFRPYAFGHNF
ncbi:hypothetical protein AB205_0096530 [Aquarana catesbeiana]|uniref:Uncharacterized protein n=1 Tax=Aquarana catesbeiana TaxID=8400 RepID=A0A2G9Q7F7_AQUCT|nr:hypothetical protein AB205_0096530 [Aquarana catesbeiana]